MIYEFGDGLSYTEFTYKWIYMSVVSEVGTVASDSVIVNVSVNITNSGTRFTASETVLLFLVPPTGLHSDSPSGAPKKLLRNFEKVRLPPSGHEVVSFALTRNDFSLADPDGITRLVRGDWSVCVGALSRGVRIP